MQSMPSFDTPPTTPARNIPEDTLHYTIHLPPSLTESTTPESLATLISQFVEDRLGGEKGWLWHRDSWQLCVVPERDIQDRRRRFGEVVEKTTGAGDVDSDSDSEGESGNTTVKANGKEPEGQAEGWKKLEGRMRIGDAVDDEWLVVWLLRRVSERWEGGVVSIRDTDGEFLLIEAADHLPRWLTPDNAENRFWLVNGHFQLIPPQYTSSGTRPQKQFIEDDEDDEARDGDAEGAWISEGDALRRVAEAVGREGPKGEYWVGEALERDILRRIDGYPAALSTHHQHTMAYLPINIAKALRVDPSLVQRAVEGFYMRDPAQLRAAARTTRFPPTPSTSIVLAPVTMTRVAYAQLKGQIFHPPRTFGNEWRVPPIGDEAVSDEERARREREARWRDIGVKVIMGFEIMYREDNKRSKGAGEDSIDEKDPPFGRYVENLKRAGFFGENLEGSQDWQRRMAEAKRGWIRVNDSETRTSFADAVDAALKATMDLDVSQLAVPETYTEDSEAWLEVSPDELDGLLSRSGDAKPAPAMAEGQGEDAEAQAQAASLSELAKKVGKFVEGKGDLEGARFEDELSDEDDFMVDSDDESDAERSMQVDPVMTEAEKRDRLQALVPGIKPEEWGRQTQDMTTLTSATEKKAVSFADGTKDAAADKHSEDAALEKARRSRFEPTDYEGHLVESGDETDEEDGEQSMPSWTAHKAHAGKKKRGPIDPTIYQLSEALKTGKVGPIEGWKDRSEAEDLEMSDAEDEVVEGDIDMDQEEEEFLKFARDALGIDEAMWTGMLEERKSRGAYIPGDRENQPSGSTLKTEPPRSTKAKPAKTTSETTPPFRAPPVNSDGRNPDLDSFEKVMEAMEAELARAKAQPGTSQPPKIPKPEPASTARSSAANPLPPLPTEADLDGMDEDDLIAMDRELRAALKNAGISDDEDFSDEDMDDETREGLQGLTEDSKGEFRMMKDFLESYKAQGGQSGVVGNLFGRLGGK